MTDYKYGIINHGNHAFGGMIMTVIMILIILGIAYLILRSRFKSKMKSQQLQKTSDTGPFKANISGYFKCPSCGATVRIVPDDSSIGCPFCNAKLPEAEKLREATMNAAENQKQRDFEREKMIVAERHDKRRFISDMTDNIGEIIMFVFILLLVGGTFYGLYYLINLF